MITQFRNVPIFRCTVFFVGDCSGAEAEDAVYKLGDRRTQVSFDHTSDGGVRSSGGDVFVWVKNLEQASCVAHELAHTACAIMENHGVPLCPETEEVMCYLIGWLKINIQDDVYEKYQKEL